LQYFRATSNILYKRSYFYKEIVNRKIMIQRIQSLYLTLIILFSILFLSGSFLNFFDTSGTVIKVTLNGIIRVTEVQSSELIEIVISIPVISLLTILLYKNRKIQLWLAFSVIMLAVSLIFASIFYSCSVSSTFSAKINPGVNLVIPLLILLFSILAYRGVRNDDRLIRSYDRLR
jgi:hypothetical protein